MGKPDPKTLLMSGVAFLVVAGLITLLVFTIIKRCEWLKLGCPEDDSKSSTEAGSTGTGSTGTGSTGTGSTGTGSTRAGSTGPSPSPSPSRSPSTSPSPSLAGKSYRVDPVAFSYVTISFATGTTGSYRGYDDNGSGDLNGSFTYSVSGSTISLSAYIPLINENSFRINNNTLIGNSTGTSLNKI